MMIRIELPFHLRTLAGVSDEVRLEVAPPVTVRSALDALEAQYPMLRGTIRDHGTLARRPFVRFFACGVDMSLMRVGSARGGGVVKGQEALVVVGAIAGG